MFDPKPFVKLLQRLNMCGYPNAIMNNRLMFQCYDTGTDSEQGFHYALVIPDATAKGYSNDFYDSGPTLIVPGKLSAAYRKGHGEIEAFRKEKKLKPSEAHEECYFSENDDGWTFKFVFTCEDLVKTESVTIPKTRNFKDMTDNAVLRYQDLLDRIKLGGACMTFNGMRDGTYSFASSSPTIYTVVVKLDGRRLEIPIAKSMFLGLSPDRFSYSIQESTIPNVLIFSMSLMKAGIAEIQWGYLIEN